MEWILVGILVVAMIVLMFVQSRKQKKAQDDYLAILDSLRVGVKVKMASGLLGRIKEIREEAPGFKTVVLETGDAKNPVAMTFVLEAVQGIVNEEAINKLNLQKAADQLNAVTKPDASAGQTLVTDVAEKSASATAVENATEPTASGAKTAKTKKTTKNRK